MSLGRINIEQFQSLVDVSRETLDRLKIYEDLLVRWQRVKNLVAPSTLSHLWIRHFADSAQLLKLAPAARHWVDLGSGAGFPGLVIAVFLADVTDSQVVLVESDHRKCAFLREVIRATGAQACVLSERIETALERIERTDVVMARALMHLSRLLEFSKPLIDRGAEGLFLKGQDVASELTEDAIFSMFDLEFIPSLTHPSARIVRARRKQC